MTRLSISLSKQNDEWLKNQLNEEEFNSKSEAINHLIKQARSQEEYYDYVRMKIEKGEKSGISSTTKEELLARIKRNLVQCMLIICLLRQKTTLREFMNMVFISLVCCKPTSTTIKFLSVLKKLPQILLCFPQPIISKKGIELAFVALTPFTFP